MILNNIEVKIILRWYDENTKNRFGDNIFYIGEENSIFQKLDKIKNNKGESEIYFSYSELNILKNWSNSNFGLYEEKNLIKKIDKELEKSKKDLLNFIKGSIKKTDNEN
ncbi:MAG: hypothetical protein N3A58_04030 [Spirochaetes bacterium]|nr:hypothetical protein [Spirochaetota bacterium]